jgi:hypothetical protein
MHLEVSSGDLERRGSGAFGVLPAATIHRCFFLTKLFTVSIKSDSLFFRLLDLEHLSLS